MAKQVKNSDLVQPKLWQETVEETEALITVLGNLEASFKKVSAEAAKTAKNANPGNAKGIKDINAVTELLKKTSIETDKVRAEIAKAEAQRTKAAVAAAKQRTTEEKKSLNDREKVAKTLLKQRETREKQAEKVAIDRLKQREKVQKDVEKRLIQIQKEKAAQEKQLEADRKRIDRERGTADKQTIAELNKSIKARERKVIAQKKEEAATIKLAARTKEQNRAYNKASAELNTLRKRFKDLAVSGNGTKKEMAALLFQITRLDAKLKSVDKTVGQSQRNVGNYSSAFKGLRGGIASAIGPMIGITAAVAGVTAGLRASVSLFRDFGLATAKVQAITGDTSGSLTAQAKALGVSTAFTASNVAELQLNLSKLGFTTGQIEDSTEAILNFALATDSELGRAAEVTASTLNAFNLEASEAGRISDVAAKAFNSTALDIEKFATAIAVVGPAANATGVSIEKTTAILGKIVDAGIDASTAGSALRNVFIDIADKGITLDDALKEISTSQNKLSTANELFGKRGAVVATVIADNVEEINKLDKSFQNAAGSAGAASAIIGDTLDGDIKKFTSSIQGLILGNKRLNQTFRSIIKGLTGMIKAFAGVEDVQKNLIDSNLEQLKTSEENIAKNSELANTYKELSSQENLTAEETELLNSVKGQLLSTFDSSIAKINEETGAIEVNIEALEAKIAAEVLLSSEAAKNLIAEKSRLQVQIALASNVGTVAKAQLENNTSLSTGVFLALRQIKTAEDYNRVLNELNDTTGKGRDQGAEDIKTAIELEGALGRTARASFELSGNQIDLAKIENDLLDLGIDLNQIAKERVSSQKGLNAELTKTKDLEDTELKDAELKIEENFQKSRLLLLEKSDKEIRIAQNKEFESDARLQEEVIRLQEKLSQELTDLEIDRLQDLIEKRFEILKEDDLEQIKLKQQLQKILTEVTIEGLEDRANAEKKLSEEAQKAREKAEAQRLKDIAKLEEEIKQGTIDAIDVIDQAFAKSSQNRLDEIDRETAALKTREDALRQAAQNGSELAEENLATNQRLQAEQERVRDEQVKKAQRRELILAGLKAFAENAGEPGAVGKTLSDITTLSAALINLNPFFHGTDDTGKGGAVSDSYGAVTGYTHEDEMVLSKKDRGDIGFDKTRVDIKDAFAFQDMHQFDQVPIIQVQRFESNTEVLQKFDVLAEKLDNLPHRMPRIVDEKFDEKSKVYKTVIKTGNKIENNHRKVKGIWG